VINAAASEEGRAFAVRNADYLLTATFDPARRSAMIDGVEKMAQQEGRPGVGVLSNAYVVCRPTQDEAEEFVRYYAEENADWAGVDIVMNGQGINRQSFGEDLIAMFRPRFAAGHGGSPLVGTPDSVAEQIVQFAQAGLGGLALSFVDYAAELEYFAAEVIPRLAAAGVRKRRGD
jgi:FMNH2-dependent dimethyl sulfone monooxygenase